MCRTMLAVVDCWQAGAGLTGLLNGWSGGWANSLVVDDGADACRKLQKKEENKVDKEILKDAFLNMNYNKKQEVM